MTVLTQRQSEILAFVRAYSQEHGYPPSFRDIGDHFGIRSSNGVWCHLKALEDKGLIARRPRAARAIAVL